MLLEPVCTCILAQPVVSSHNEELMSDSKPSLQLKQEEPGAPLGLFVRDAVAAVVAEQGVAHDDVDLAAALDLAGAVDAVGGLVHVHLGPAVMASHDEELMSDSKPSLQLKPGRPYELD